MDSATQEQKAQFGETMRKMIEVKAEDLPKPIVPTITVTRTPPKHLQIRGLIRCPRALRMARQAVVIATNAYWEDHGAERETMIARAKARFDWGAEAEKTFLLRRKRKAQAAARKRARNQRRKA